MADIIKPENLLFFVLVAFKPSSALCRLWLLPSYHYSEGSTDRFTLSIVCYL